MQNKNKQDEVIQFVPQHFSRDQLTQVLQAEVFSRLWLVITKITKIANKTTISLSDRRNFNKS